MLLITLRHPMLILGLILMIQIFRIEILEELQSLITMLDIEIMVLW